MRRPYSKDFREIALKRIEDGKDIERYVGW
ncbi:hypothetical protein MIDIC_140071 [Alphaproteobacteria bacterium]